MLPKVTNFLSIDWNCSTKARDIISSTKTGNQEALLGKCKLLYQWYYCKPQFKTAK